jgi:hypothetical protein
MTGSLKIRKIRLKPNRRFVDLSRESMVRVDFLAGLQPQPYPKLKPDLHRFAPPIARYRQVIGTLWLTQEQNIFKKHGLDSSLIYIRGGTTAVQALLAGEIQFGHLSPAPMMAAWAQGADFVWIGTTTHQMVFTCLAMQALAKAPTSKGKKSALPAWLRQRSGGACRARTVWSRD